MRPMDRMGQWTRTSLAVARWYMDKRKRRFLHHDFIVARTLGMKLQHELYTPHEIARVKRILDAAVSYPMGIA